MAKIGKTESLLLCDLPRIVLSKLLYITYLIACVYYCRLQRPLDVMYFLELEFSFSPLLPRPWALVLSSPTTT